MGNFFQEQYCGLWSSAHLRPGALSPRCPPLVLNKLSVMTSVFSPHLPPETLLQPHTNCSYRLYLCTNYHPNITLSSNIILSVTEHYLKTLNQVPKNDFFLKSTPSFGSPIVVHILLIPLCPFHTSALCFGFLLTPALAQHQLYWFSQVLRGHIIFPTAHTFLE